MSTQISQNKIFLQPESLLIWEYWGKFVSLADICIGHDIYKSLEYPNKVDINISYIIIRDLCILLNYLFYSFYIWFFVLFYDKSVKVSPIFLQYFLFSLHSPPPTIAWIHFEMNLFDTFIKSWKRKNWKNVFSIWSPIHKKVLTNITSNIIETLLCLWFYITIV